VRLRDAPSLGEQQSHRLLGRADDVGLGRVHDHHPPSCGGLDVDVIEPDAGARDDLQIGGSCEHLAGDLRGAADDQCVVRRDLGCEVARGEVEPLVDLEVRSKQVDPLRRKRLCDEDPHDTGTLTRCARP